MLWCNVSFGLSSSRWRIIIVVINECGMDANWYPAKRCLKKKIEHNKYSVMITHNGQGRKMDDEETEKASSFSALACDRDCVIS